MAQTNLLAEHHTRGAPRVFVEYSNLCGDWCKEAKRVATTFEIDLDAPQKGAIQRLLTTDLRRQRFCGAVADSRGTDWLSAAYEAPLGLPRMDR